MDPHKTLGGLILSLYAQVLAGFIIFLQKNNLFIKLNYLKILSNFAPFSYPQGAFCVMEGGDLQYISSGKKWEKSRSC